MEKIIKLPCFLKPQTLPFIPVADVVYTFSCLQFLCLKSFYLCFQLPDRLPGPGDQADPAIKFIQQFIINTSGRKRKLPDLFFLLRNDFTGSLNGRLLPFGLFLQFFNPFQFITGNIIQHSRKGIQTGLKGCSLFFRNKVLNCLFIKTPELSGFHCR